MTTTPIPSPRRRAAPTAAPTPNRAEPDREVLRLHIDLLAIGLGLGLIALAASTLPARWTRVPDEGWVAVALVIAVVGVLVADRQLAASAVAAVAIAAALGGAFGRWCRTRAWAPDAYVGALVALAVVFAALPDTEGASLLGAAMVPVALGALVRRTWWLGAASGAAVATMASAVGLVAVDAAAGRTSALVITAVGAVVSAGLVVAVVRLLLGRPFTSEPGRPSP